MSGNHALRTLCVASAGISCHSDYCLMFHLKRVTSALHKEFQVVSSKGMQIDLLRMFIAHADFARLKDVLEGVLEGPPLCRGG